MKRMLTLAALAVLCTGFTSNAGAAKKGGADAAIAEGDVKAPTDRATGQASGKRVAAKAPPIAAGKASRRALPVKGGQSTGEAGKYVPVTTSQGTKCCAECSTWSGNTCTEWGGCKQGTTGMTNCDKFNNN